MSPPSAGPAFLAFEPAQPGSTAPTRPHAPSEPGERGPASQAHASTEAALAELHTRLAAHPFWDNRLLQACRRGLLTREDFAFIFSQYALLTRSASRFVHALLAQCDSETWCARLTQALWEEGGAQPQERWPATLFRRFLREGLGVDTEAIRFQDSTHSLLRECLDWCLRSPPGAASAFLALGLEAPIPRLYSIFVDGLLKAGVSERHLHFFQRAMSTDSARARLLEELVRSQAREPGWFDTCLHALERALALQEHFLESLFDSVQHRRLGPLLERIQAGLPLAPDCPDPRTLHLGDVSTLTPFYRQAHEPRGIDFTVERVPFPGEVLETALVRVAPGRRTEPREHAQEVLLVVLSGAGRVHVRGTEVEVKPGDAVFAPRWTRHQACATGSEPLVLLAVTDHGLTRHAHEEERLRAAHLQRATGVEL